MPSTMNFLSLEYLEKSLSKYFKKNVTVVHFDTKKINVLGFCGEFENLVVTYCTSESAENLQFSIIIKMFPENESMAEILISMKSYEIEHGVYSEVLPAISNLGYREKIAPNLVSFIPEPKSTLLLENLSSLGYEMSNSKCGLLDLQHCLLVIEKLAYLHAASVTIYEKDSSFFKKYKMGLFSTIDTSRNLATINMLSLRELCEKIPDLRLYSSKFCTEKIIEKMFQSRELSPNLNVLNHGDLSPRNLMFRYDKNKEALDVLFLDFQNAFFCSPVWDLHYFWVCCTNIDVKLNHQEKLFNHYHKELVKNLVKMQATVNPPTSEEIQEDYHERATFGFALSILVLPIIMPQQKEALENFLDYDGEDRARKTCLNNPEYIKHLRLLLPLYDSLGVFD